MRINPFFLHFLLLLALPFLVSGFELGLLGTSMLMFLWLLSRWILVIRSLRQTGGPDLILESIPASHFVEKVRWCLDRAGIQHTEQPNGATLGAFFTGRTVPRLRFRTGIVYSSIGNSSEILRYLWGRYGHELGEHAEFLRPTEAGVKLEQRLDQYGRNLQTWIYYHVLPNRRLLLRAWGVHDTRIPIAQRWLVRLCSPVLGALVRRAFRINDRSMAKCTGYIESFLGEMNEILASRDCLLDQQRTYLDYTLASMTGLWLQPPEYGNGRANQVRLDLEDYTPQLEASVKQWTAAFPHVVRFTRNLYATERSISAS